MGGGVVANKCLNKGAFEVCSRLGFVFIVLCLSVNGRKCDSKRNFFTAFSNQISSKHTSTKAKTQRQRRHEPQRPSWALDRQGVGYIPHTDCFFLPGFPCPTSTQRKMCVHHAVAVGCSLNFILSAPLLLSFIQLRVREEGEH